MFGEVLLESRHPLLVRYVNDGVVDSDDLKKTQWSQQEYAFVTWIWDSLHEFIKLMCTSPTTMRRRLHSRRSCMVILSSCLFTIFFYHLMVSTVNGMKRSRRGVVTSPSARYLTYTMHGDVNESTNFTQQMWLFKNSDAERIYLYTKLLTEHEWKVNDQNMKLLRYELNTATNVTTDRDLIITQENVKVGEELPCYVVSKTYWLDHYAVDETFISTLPKESPIAGKKYKRCAVVGNSGSVNNTQCGSEIDGMDFVFRCNAAPIEPFKSDAGSKTNFITFNPSIVYKHFGGLGNESMIESYVEYMSQYNSVIWYPCFGSRKLVDICLQSMSYHDRIRSQLVIGHPKHYSSIWEFWKRRGLKKKPSTGLYLMNVAATMCDEIHLYGFWPFPVEIQEGSFLEVPYHYFDKMPFSSYHNTDTEFRILLQLHMLGVINLHFGSCKAS